VNKSKKLILFSNLCTYNLSNDSDLDRHQKVAGVSAVSGVFAVAVVSEVPSVVIPIIVDVLSVSWCSNRFRRPCSPVVPAE
jgi:hypothetical protein